MMMAKAANVPQVQAESMGKSMDFVMEWSERGKDKFWMRRNLPLDDLGTIERGDVWKSPMRNCTSSLAYSPR